MAEAFKGTDVLIYIPSLTFPSVARIMEFENAIVQIALKEELQGSEYTLAGPKAWSINELAELLSQVSGSPIVYDPLSNKEFAELYDRLKGF